MAGAAVLGSTAPILPMDFVKHLESIFLAVPNSTRLADILALFCFDQGQLLSISAAYGDLETVRYLLTERLVELPTEPTDDNPAVVAAQFGHTDVVQELLESLPGKSQSMSSSPPLRDPLFLGTRQVFGGAALQNVYVFTLFTSHEIQKSGSIL